MKINEIQKIIKDFEESSLTELSLEFEDTKIQLSKNVSSSINVPVGQNVESNAESPIKEEVLDTNEKNCVRSPLVGTFYAASSPKSKPYVEKGKQVKKGDVLCLVEAMKIMNEIVAPKDGVITKIYALNGQVVGIEEPLFDLE